LVILGVNGHHTLQSWTTILYAGQPTVSLTSLLEAVLVFHTNPLLLLRLAETSTVDYNKVVIMVTVTMVIVIIPAGIDKLCKAAALS